MARSSGKPLNADRVGGYFDKLAAAEKEPSLPIYYELDGEHLILYGTNNIGERDEHNIWRGPGLDLCYLGPLEVRGHIGPVRLMTVGEESDLRIDGSITGDSLEKRAILISKDGTVTLADHNPVERKLVIYAKIEAASGINIYKRQLIHCELLNHADDVIIRSQTVMDTSIKSPSLNMNVSTCRNTELLTDGDAMLKGCEFSNCTIKAKRGDVYLCAGHIRNCVIEAEYDIEISGQVDAWTLERLTSRKGQIRTEGRVLKPAKATGPKLVKKSTSQSRAQQ